MLLNLGRTEKKSIALIGLMTSNIQLKNPILCVYRWNVIVAEQFP